MATMSITQACAVNTLLDWITGRDWTTGRESGEAPSSGQALRAAQELAKHANRALSAGWRPEQLPAAWPEDRRG